MQTITIRKLDDWHAHLRDGAMLKAVAPFTAKRFVRAVVMPNLKPPVRVIAEMEEYRARVLEATKAYPQFTPLMTLYLTDTTEPEGAMAVKYYPANATTNSELGLSDIRKAYTSLEKMQKSGIPLLLHGEDPAAAPEDREKVFLDTTLPQLLKDFPALKVVLEHATTTDAVQFVQSDTSGRLAATVTVHHLILTRDEATTAYEKCMPIIKTGRDRAALRKAVTSGDARFFLGTDSAPHPVSAKESANPPAGIFTAPAAIELYAQVFDEEGKSENLEKFASLSGPAFYGMEPNEEKITLEKNPWTIDTLVDVSDGSKIRPFGYHEEAAKRLQIQWKLA
jgi:dihydroorotase